MAKAKNSGLGRGLDSIFLDNSIEETGSGVTMLRLSEIEPNPDQPRKDFDTEALTTLAESIAAHGLIQPIVVRPSKTDGYYRIIAGERRWRASKMAGLIEVPVIMMDADDKKASQLALIENIQRENLNPIEEANALAVLLDTYELTQDELSRAIGKSRSAIANLLRLLDLPDEVVVMIREEELSVGHGKVLLSVKDPEQIIPIAKTVLRRELTVRQTEELVRAANRKKPESAPEELPSATVDYIEQLAKRMSSKLGREIHIRNTDKVKRLEITFADDTDLDDIVRKLCGDDVWDVD